MPDATHSPIAVVGVSALFPGSLDATGFWRDILAGSDLITDVPPSHWLIDDHFDPDMLAKDKTYMLYCGKGVMSRLHASHLLESGGLDVKVYAP